MADGAYASTVDLCKPPGWVMSQLSLQIPGQRRGTMSCWLAIAPGCGYRPSCKEREKVVLVAVNKRRGSRENCRKERVQKHEKTLCASVVPCRRAGKCWGVWG